MKLERILVAVLAVIVAGQAIASCVERGARREERITAANELAAASKTERRVVAQLQIATRYIYQGQLELERELRDRPATLKVKVDAALEGRRDTGTVAPPLTVSSTSVHFKSSWGNLDTTGYRVSNDVLITGVGPIVGERPIVNISYDVELAPARFRIRVSCEGANARVAIAGPRVRPITIEGSSAATADVCNPPAPSWRPFTMQLPSLPWSAALLTIGGVIGAILSR